MFAVASQVTLWKDAHWVGLLYVSCSSQTRLRPLPVQTQGTQLLKLFIQIYYINGHQQYENVTIEVSPCSMFKNHNSMSIINHSKTNLNLNFKDTKDSWGSYTATGSEITEREQLCNTHLNRIYFNTNYIISPTRHREIVETELHPEIDTKWFIKAKNQMQGFFN